MDSDAAPVRGLSLSETARLEREKVRGRKSGSSQEHTPPLLVHESTVDTTSCHHSLDLLASTAEGHSDPSEAFHASLPRSHWTPGTSLRFAALTKRPLPSGRPRDGAAVKGASGRTTGGCGSASSASETKLPNSSSMSSARLGGLRPQGTALAKVHPHLARETFA